MREFNKKKKRNKIVDFIAYKLNTAEAVFSFKF